MSVPYLAYLVVISVSLAENLIVCGRNRNGRIFKGESDYLFIIFLKFSRFRSVLKYPWEDLSDLTCIRRKHSRHLFFG